MSALAKSWLRRARAEVLDRIGANARARARLDGSCAAVLAYHRVLPLAEARRLHVEPGMLVTPETFARHVDWLAEELRVLPLHEIVDRLGRGERLPERACAITFDDGWRDNLVHALPELRRRALPATLFVVTERVGTAGAFWPDEVCRRLAALPEAEAWRAVRALGAGRGDGPADALLAQLKGEAEAGRTKTLDALRAATPAPPAAERELLDWEELDRLAAGGVEVESHGASHAILTGLSDADVDRDLGLALRTLEERGHGRRRLLAYPSGAFDARVAARARAAGYRAAVTTLSGLVGAACDPLALPRLGLHEDVSRSRAEWRLRVPGPI
jgi:peptidoglycan/xylan/chitin deacetylase (PgdA/CDA1 family)